MAKPRIRGRDVMVVLLCVMPALIFCGMVISAAVSPTSAEYMVGWVQGASGWQVRPPKSMRYDNSQNDGWVSGRQTFEWWFPPHDVFTGEPKHGCK